MYAFPYFLVVAVLVVLFILLIRELVCWYWKINLIKETLGTIDAKLEQFQKSNHALETSIGEGMETIASTLVALHRSAEKQVVLLEQMQQNSKSQQ